MSKPIDKERADAHYSGMLAELTGPVQPQIDKSLELLHSGCQEYPGALMLDFYGFFDGEDGYTVEDVALTGTTISLSDLVSEKALIGFSLWCDDTLPSAAEMKEDAKQEALIDRAELRKELES